MVNNSNKNFLIGGRLGDFIHSLAVPKYLYETYRIKARIFIAEKGDIFSNGLLNTFTELLPIISKQDYCESFTIYDKEDIDYDLTDFRHSTLLYNKTWLEIMFGKYLPDELNIPFEFKWLKAPDKFESYNNIVYINRSLRSNMDLRILRSYIELIETYYGYDIRFLCSDKKQYDSFYFKDSIILDHCVDLLDMVNKIGNCKYFIGNQSTPFAIASALNVPRSLELMDGPDKNHYIGDKRYYKNFNCF